MDTEDRAARDPLNEMLRAVARNLIAHALEAEMTQLQAAYAYQLDVQGHARVNRERSSPGAGRSNRHRLVTVQVPKVHSRQGEQVTSRSTLVPPDVRKTRSLEAALPWLYLKEISTDEMQESLEALVGLEAKGLSASTVARLKQQWREEYALWRHRRLDDEQWIYIWVDGIYRDICADSQRLCAWVLLGVNAQGEKSLLAIEGSVREST